MYDIIFLLETNLGYDVLPSFESYTKFADPDKRNCKFGGIACYVKRYIGKSFISNKI